MSREREKEGKILYMDKNEYSELEGGWYPTFQQSFDWLIIYSIECLLSLFADKRIDGIKVIHIYRLTDDSLMLINPTGKMQCGQEIIKKWADSSWNWFLLLLRFTD